MSWNNFEDWGPLKGRFKCHFELTKYSWLRYMYKKISHWITNLLPYRASFFDNWFPGPCRLMILQSLSSGQWVQIKNRKKNIKKDTAKYAKLKQKPLIISLLFYKGKIWYFSFHPSFFLHWKCQQNVQVESLSYRKHLLYGLKYLGSKTSSVTYLNMTLVLLMLFLLLFLCISPISSLHACLCWCVCVISGCDFPLLLAPGELHTCSSSS